MRHEIDKEQWACAAKYLASVDRQFTQECRSGEIVYEEVESALAAGYTRCWGSGYSDQVEAALAIGG